MEEGEIQQLPFEQQQKKAIWKSFLLLRKTEEDSTEAHTKIAALCWSEKGHIKSPLSSITWGTRGNPRSSQDSLWEAVRNVWNVEYKSQCGSSIWDLENWWFHLPRNPWRQNHSNCFDQKGSSVSQWHLQRIERLQQFWDVDVEEIEIRKKHH